MSNDSHLPRILCLHGGGTNARIFHAQCRVLRSQLQGIFRLVFAEGPFSSEPGPDVVSVYKDWGPFKGWIPPVIEDGISDAPVWHALQSTMEEDTRMGGSGPWLGVLGFSQGASACANLLLRIQQDAGKRQKFPFRFGVLIAGRTPDSVVALRRKKGGYFSGFGGEMEGWSFWQTVSTSRLWIPTVHVHGLQDVNIDLHRKLLRDFCDAPSAKVMEWNGGHRVPIKSGDVKELVHLILETAVETCDVDISSVVHLV